MSQGSGKKEAPLPETTYLEREMHVTEKVCLWMCGCGVQSTNAFTNYSSIKNS